jgi:hypothetical protein
MVKLRALLPIPILLACAGCGARRAWRLTGQVLTPPGKANGAFAAPKTTALEACPRDAAIQLRGRKVMVDRAALEKQPRGWLANWSMRCFDATRVLESVPLSNGAGFRLMHADDLTAGFVDLGPGNRLEVLSPIVREGTPPDAPLVEETAVSGTDNRIQVTLKASPNLIGQETKWYRFEAQAGGGSQIAPAGYFQFTPNVRFYRLFYKPEEQTAIVVGAASRDRLPRDLTACGQSGGPECVTLPKRVGINPYVEVKVNGAPIAVPAHMPPTVRAVIQAAKAKTDTVLPTLAITKPYAGKPVPVLFDRTKPDVLGLVLTGNEEIRW